eukprot:TRINITY_DN12526_c0_g1_i1.p1 TRINITY_DN12526_c0_g1~~TRINITY_DN12526_c0_g1_i1.p1  ORF type:complete len:145 (+),score=32.72 TRINITY_DN12526_c0_g1_i1:69-503(+)
MKLVLLVLVVLAPLGVLTENSNCLELGFSETLVCSACTKLEQFVKSSELLSECRKCCAEESGSQLKAKYSSARLEICTSLVYRYPNVHEFIKNKAKQFPQLEIRYTVGMAPTLFMSDKQTEDSISVATWKTDTIEDFLREKLKK